MKFARFQIDLSHVQLTMLATAFIIATSNTTFFANVTNIYPWSFSNSGFLLSLAVLLGGLLTLLISLFSLIIPVRIVISAFILMAVPIGYASSRFGTVIDTSMIRNILETDMNEASDLLTAGFLLHVLMLGIIPTICVWKLPVKFTARNLQLRNGLALIGSAIAVILICAFSFGAQYASFFREHKPLRYYANPVFAIYSTGKYFLENMSIVNEAELTPVLPNASVPSTDGHRELIIVVVGEAARADRFSLNGYERATNPYLATEDRIVSFTSITACGTSTAISTPCIFAPQGRSEFKRNAASRSENLLDVLKNAGVNVFWRDNNSGSKGVAARVRYEAFNTPEANRMCDVECRDIGMLSGLQDYIDSQDGDILIVLHQMGNHGPAYFKRYPVEYENFTPACHSAELSECTLVEISNAYDNAIVYTDYFLSRVIALLKSNTPRFETTMLYVSDHGESLGEKGAFLHGLPYLFAPAEQIRVPLILWVGETSDIDLTSALALKDQPSSHDAIFNSLLLAFEVTDRLPDAPRTLFNIVEESE